MRCGGSWWAAQTLSLEECRAAAVEHNRTLRNSRLDLDAASQTHREAFTNYFPQISASGGLFQAQHGLVQADFAVPQMGTLPVSMVKRGIVGSVTAVQPLFAGLKIVTGNKLARLGEEVGRLQRSRPKPRCASGPMPVSGRSCRSATTFRPSMPWSGSWPRYAVRSNSR